MKPSKLTTLLVAALLVPALTAAEQAENLVFDNPAANIQEAIPLSNEAAGSKGKPSKAAGALSLVGGILLVPVGLGVAIGNSFEKCEERDGGLVIGVGPCSKNGPDEAGQAVGWGLAGTGVFLIFLGIAKLSR